MIEYQQPQQKYISPHHHNYYKIAYSIKKCISITYIFQFIVYSYFMGKHLDNSM